MNVFVGYESQDLQVKLDETKANLKHLVLKDKNVSSGFQSRIVVIDRLSGRLTFYTD